MTRRWILVENRPLERPRASFGVPLFRPPHDGGFGFLFCRRSGVCSARFRMVQGVQNVLPKSRNGPETELAADRRPIAELLREIPRRRSCSLDPKSAIQDKTMIFRLAAVRMLDRLDEAFKKYPFDVRNKVARKDHLLGRDDLQSQDAAERNLFRQHDLAAGMSSRCDIRRSVGGKRWLVVTVGAVPINRIRFWFPRLRSVARIWPCNHIFFSRLERETGFSCGRWTFVESRGSLQRSTRGYVH